MLAKSISMNINPRYHQSEEQIVSEQDYIEAAKTDPQQFGFVYDKYYEAVFRFIYQRTANENSAHELTSEVFYKALKNIQKYEFRGLPFSSWLLRIAHNEVIKNFRVKSRSKVVMLKTDHLENIMDEIEDDSLEQFKPALLRNLKELNEADLELVQMRFFEDRPFKEIAEIFEKKESAIKMKLYRILEKLKGKIIH